MGKTMRRTPDNRVVTENDARGFVKRGQVIPVDLTEIEYAELDQGVPEVTDLVRDLELCLETAREPEGVYAGQGWFGSPSQLEHYLAVVGCDRDEHGRFMVGGGVFTGLDGDVAVGGDAYYLAGGQKKNLAAGLRTTSYGLSVLVIG